MNLSKLFLMSNFVTSQAFFKPPVIKPPFNRPKPIQSNNGGLDCNGLGCELVRTTDPPNFWGLKINDNKQISEDDQKNAPITGTKCINGPGQELVKQLGKQSDKKNHTISRQCEPHPACKNFEEAVKKTIKTKPQ